MKGLARDEPKILSLGLWSQSQTAKHEYTNIYPNGKNKYQGKEHLRVVIDMYDWGGLGNALLPWLRPSCDMCKCYHSIFSTPSLIPGNRASRGKTTHREFIYHPEHFLCISPEKRLLWTSRVHAASKLLG